MNIKYKINRLLQEIEVSDRKEGYVKIYPNNSPQHELIKFLIADKLKRKGFKVYSECRFTQNRGKADLVVISPEAKGFVIEIMGSETEERLEKKMCKYPMEFEIIPVNTSNFHIETFEI